MIISTEDLISIKKRYRDYVENFDPTPQYLYDEPYSLLEFDQWLEEVYVL